MDARVIRGPGPGLARQAGRVARAPLALLRLLARTLALRGARVTRLAWNTDAADLGGERRGRREQCGSGPVVLCRLEHGRAQVVRGRAGARRRDRLPVHKVGRRRRRRALAAVALSRRSRAELEVLAPRDIRAQRCRREEHDTSSESWHQQPATRRMARRRRALLLCLGVHFSSSDLESHSKLRAVWKDLIRP